MRSNRLLLGLQRRESAALDIGFRFFLPRLEKFIERNMGARVRRWHSPNEIAVDVFFETVYGLAGMEQALTVMRVQARMLQVAKNRLKDYSCRCRRLVGESGLAPGYFANHKEPDNRNEAEERDTRRWVRELTSKLSQTHRDAILLCTYLDLTYRQAATILRIKPDTLRKRHRKALELLQGLGDPRNA